MTAASHGFGDPAFVDSLYTTMLDSLDDTSVSQMDLTRIGRPSETWTEATELPGCARHRLSRVHTVGLSWQHAAETAVVLGAGGAALARSTRPRHRSAGAFLRELATIAALYGLWRLAGRIAVSGTGHAISRAHSIERFDARLPLPSEQAVQHAVLGNRLLVEGANWYYAAMHLSVMGAFLLWLFWRHRDRYRPVRQVMAWTTLGCLLIQLVPVAPPRMLPGFVDTGLLYHQSVYSHGLPIDQLSAMPSVHVAWAVCVGYYLFRVSPSRWRWFGPVHAA